MGSWYAGDMYGEFVRRARASRQLSQSHLARISGVAQANISAIENDRRLPSAATLHRLLHACGYALEARAGDRSVRCAPPMDDHLERVVDAPPLTGPDTPIRTRVRLINAALDTAEAIVRAR